MEWLIWIFYAILLLLTLLVQPKWKLGTRLRATDKLYLLIGFKLFYPNPVKADYFVSYRILDPHSQTFGEWLTLKARKRKLAISWLINTTPDAVMLLRLGNYFDHHLPRQASEITYRHLLHYLRYQSGDLQNTIQFRVTTKQLHNPAATDKLIFESPVHSFPDK